MGNFCLKDAHAETGQKMSTGQPARPANFLFFLDKQLSLKIKASQPGFWHCTGDPSNFCMHFMNLGLKHPSARQGRDLGLEQASSASALLTFWVGSFFAWGVSWASPASAH